MSTAAADPVGWEAVGRVEATKRRPCPECPERQYRVEIQDATSACSGSRMGWACPGCGALEEDPRP